VLQNADDHAEQGIVLEQLLPRLRTDVGHEGQDLEDLLLDLDVDLVRHQHSQQWLDVVGHCGGQVFVPLVDEASEQLD